MNEAVDLGRETRLTVAGSPEALGEWRSQGATERRLLQGARFLLTWLAAFLMIVALFSAFGRQLKAMSAPVRALLLSGVFVVAMNFLVVPGLARLLAPFDPSTRSGAPPPEVISATDGASREPRVGGAGRREG